MLSRAGVWESKEGPDGVYGIAEDLLSEARYGDVRGVNAVCDCELACT